MKECFGTRHEGVKITFKNENVTDAAILLLEKVRQIPEVDESCQRGIPIRWEIKSYMLR